jgi:hypothetical protein
VHKIACQHKAVCTSDNFQQAFCNLNGEANTLLPLCRKLLAASSKPLATKNL